MNETEYRNYSALHYSLLSTIATNPPLVIEGKDLSDSEAVKQGQAFDCYLTRPDDFENEYTCITTNKPTASHGILVDAMLEFYDITGKDPDNTDMINLRNEHELWMSVKKEEILKSKLYDNAMWKYYNEVKNARKKIVLDADVYNSIEVAAQALWEQPLTKDYFVGKRLVYQQPIIFEMNGWEYKCLYDVISIDDKNKTFTPIDIKFKQDSPYSFVKSVVRFRYDIQHALYSCDEAMIELTKVLGLEGYIPKPFTFVVTSSKYPTVAKAFRLKDISLDGFKNRYGEYVKGVNQLTDDYQYHISNNDFSDTRDVLEKGFIEVKL